MLVHIVLLALVAYWVSSAFVWPFWTVVIVLGVLYGLYRLAQHNGWVGMSPSSGGGITAGMTKFLVGFSTLTFVMMVGTVVIGVSNNYAFSYFLHLGPRPWLYPAHTTTDLLIWVSLFFISIVIAGLAANGRVKPALAIFAVTLVFLFIAREMPRTAKAIAPTPIAAMPAGATHWEKTDQSVAEKGAIPVAVDTATSLGFGKPDPDEGVIGGGVKRFWVWAFGPPAPKAPSSTTPPPPAPAASAKPTPTFYSFDATTGCVERDLGYEARWSPKDKAIRVFDPAGNSHVEELGKNAPISAFGPAKWRFCKEDPDATGVMIWE